MAKFHGISARSRVDAFAIASANSQHREMRAMVADGVDVDGISTDGFTALASAARLALTKSVDLLIELGADINKPSWENLTPLMFACSAGKTKGSRIAAKLVECGANVNYVRKSDGTTALKFAARDANPALVQTLLDAGADVDGPVNTDQTALMLAARENKVETLKVLVENGADTERICGLPWAKDLNALGLAKYCGCRKAQKYLETVTQNA